ncbi:MAG: HAMP domain-containing protein [Rhodospirillales bacterium]|nr:HAMP domain-containing protein [Rhodospirillales bacterium]
MAAKLFAILALLGAIAVLVTSVLGYLQARDALREAIYNQLTSTRKSKVQQVETYFRTIRNELAQLSYSKEAIDAARVFRTTFQELDRTDVRSNVPADLEHKVDDWYGAQFMPGVRRLSAKEPDVKAYLPVDRAAYYLQYHYIVANPYPAERRELVDDAGDGSAYSRQHAIYHPLLRDAAATFGFFDLMLADPAAGRIVYAVRKEVDFAASLRSAPFRQSNVAVAVARCGADAEKYATCLEDFAPYAPSGGAPIAFMAAPIIEQNTIIGVLIAQLSIDEIDKVVTGGRRWRQDGFGATGEAYLVGSDRLARSGPRAFYENRNRYFADLKQSGATDQEIDAIRRYGTPVLQQHIATEAVQSALAGTEGVGEIVGYLGVPTLASWGPLSIPGLNWVLVAKIDASEAFAPIDRLRRNLIIVGAVALLVVLVTSAWLSRSLLAPLRELTAGVTRFAAGDLGAKVAVRSRDEIGRLCAAFNGMVDELREKTIVIENKNRENEQLLLNMLPGPIANRLRGGEKNIADGFAEVTVAFADIVGFTAMSSQMPPADVVSLLNGLFTRFDEAAQELGIEKIKTLGDAYMAVCGLPVQVPDHAERMVRMAIRMVHITQEHALEHRVALTLRVGINSGPVVAGVIGKTKYIYDLWGDTVNLASRMESGGLPGAIQVTRSVYDKLKDRFAFEPRGVIEIKGRSGVEAWLLKI